MTPKRIYLDYSATTPLDDDVRRAMDDAAARTFGNPSSVHSYGREARALLEESRETIAEEFHAAPDEVFFTSGGTESDNAAILGVASWSAAAGRPRLLVSSVEHHAVLHAARHARQWGAALSELPVDGSGLLRMDALRGSLSSEVGLVSVMTVNNEVGTIQPVAEVAGLAHKHGALFHTDAVQALGKIPIDVRKDEVDLLSVSAHKLYGPKGIGALFIRKGTKVLPLLHGGGQESGRRPGTENVALAVGFAESVRRMRRDHDAFMTRLTALREMLRQKIIAEFGDAVIVNGHPALVLPTILSISFDATRLPVDGEALIMGMDLRGVAVTSGSACTSGSLQPSHVLLAMGRDANTARATVRFSLGRLTSEEDIAAAVEALRESVTTARRT